MIRTLNLLIVVLIVISFSIGTLFSTDTTEKQVEIDLYVMSMCPYGIPAEQMVYKLLREYPELLKVNLYYIVTENADYDKDSEEPGNKEENQETSNLPAVPQDGSCQGAPVDTGGRFSSLHGAAEVEENIRQLVIMEYFPELFWEYLNLRNQDIINSKPVDIMKSLGIDADLVENAVASEEGKDLLSKNLIVAEKNNINASPTLFVNGNEVKGSARENKILRALCVKSELDICPTLPECDDVSDCPSKEGMIVACSNPSKEEAKCVYGKEIEFAVTVINDLNNPLLSSKQITDIINGTFGKAVINEIDFKSNQAQNIIKEYSIRQIPAVIVDSKIEDSIKFEDFSGFLEKKKDKYLFKEEAIANRYYFVRQKKHKNLELFVNSISPMAMRLENLLLLDGSQSFSINYNAQLKKIDTEQLVLTKNNESYELKPDERQFSLVSAYGEADLKEMIRQLCVNKYQPEYFNSYLRCANNEGIHAQGEKAQDFKCLELTVSNFEQINKCEAGDDGIKMLAANIEYSKDLKINSEIAVLVHNQYLLQNFNLEELFQLISQQ